VLGNNSSIKDIPLEQLETDPDHSRASEIDETNLMDIWFLESIREHGLLQVLVVNRLEDNRYQIIDGHRRYACARRLGLTTVPCRVHVGLNSSEVERLRYMLQDTVKPWTRAELARARRRIKQIDWE
jgi:ParB/RepB/Spo0J family partition protein